MISSIEELKLRIKEDRERWVQIKIETIERKIKEALEENKLYATYSLLAGFENDLIKILQSEGYKAKIKRDIWFRKYLHISWEENK